MKRTCTFVAYALHTLQSVYRIASGTHVYVRFWPSLSPTRASAHNA